MEAIQTHHRPTSGRILGSVVPMLRASTVPTTLKENLGILEEGEKALIEAIRKVAVLQRSDTFLIYF